jgi:hypothetical protein
MRKELVQAVMKETNCMFCFFVASKKLERGKKLLTVITDVGLYSVLVEGSNKAIVIEGAEMLPFDENKLTLLVDGNKGIYTISELCNTYNLHGVDKDDILILKDSANMNTEESNYHEIADNIISNAIVIIDKVGHTLFENDGDIWALPANINRPENWI